MAKTLQELLQATYGVKTRIQENGAGFQVNPVETKIVSSNPNRVGCVFVNNGASNVYIKPIRPAVLNVGIKLSANGGTVTFSWDHDFELIASEWYGIADGAASNFYVLEVLTT